MPLTSLSTMQPVDDAMRESSSRVHLGRVLPVPACLTGESERVSHPCGRSESEAGDGVKKQGLAAALGLLLGGAQQSWSQPAVPLTSISQRLATAPRPAPGKPSARLP